jgi:superfamily II DNA or RNA helicase
MISITGNHAKLTAPPDVLSQCVRLFSIQDPNWWMIRTRTRGWDGKHQFITPDGHMSVGIVPTLLKALRKGGFNEYAILQDHRPTAKVSHIECPCLDHDLWDEQWELIRAFQESVVGWGCWQSATNSGKTEAAIQLIHEMGVGKVLFVVPTLVLMEQTRRRFSHAWPGRRIGVLGDSEEDIQEITVACAATLGLYAGDKSDKGRRITSYLSKEVGLVIIDEVDVAASSATKKVNRYTKFLKYCNARYRLGMSGTIKEHELLKRYRITQLVGPIVGNVTNKMQIEKGRSAKGHIVTLHYGGGVDPLEDSHRNVLIAKVAEEVANRGKQSIIFTRRLHQGTDIANAIKRRHIPTKFISGSTPKYGREATLKDMKEGKLDTLVANIILDRGVNTPAFTLGLDAHPTYDPARLKQQIGRTLRKKDEDNVFLFVLIRDNFDRHSYNQKLKLLKEEDCYTFHEVHSPEELGTLLDKVLEDERSRCSNSV